ncbi:MAG: pyrroline-5-carboxylate reductase [Firmicutes bacterium]|nr:pyrroline-5-carboxylate reductase [Bacillota bacterium]
MKYGFIGCGNMSGAVIRGALAAGIFSREDVFVTEKTPELAARKAAEFGVTACAGYKDIAGSSDILFIGLKPDVIPGFFADAAPVLRQTGKTLVSLAAGVSLGKIEEMLDLRGGAAPPLIRVMSNLNVAIGQGVTAVAGNAAAAGGMYDRLKGLFEPLGAVFELEEKLFPVFTALAGSGPAFALLFIESLAKGAHRLGMGKKAALDAAARVVLGSAANYLAESGAHPWEMIDRVCSPGGTTVEGIYALEKGGFGAAVTAAVEAAAEKARG